MAIRAKTKRRVAILAVAVVLLITGVVGLYWLRQWQKDERAKEYRQIGMAAYEAGDYETALDHLKKYLWRHGNEVEALYSFADARLNVEAPRNRHIRRAISLLQQVLDLEPGHEAARDKLLDLYLRTGFETEALTLADDLLADNPDNAEALRTKALALSRLQRYEEALPIAQRYVAIDESNLQLQLMIFDLRKRVEGASEELIADAEVLRKKHAKDPRFELLQAYAYRLSNDRANTIQWLRTAATRSAPDLRFIRILVRMLDEVRLYAESLSALEKGSRDFDDKNLERELIRRLWETNKLELVTDRLSDLDPSASDSDAELLAFQTLSLYQLSKSEEAKPFLEALAARESDDVAMAWSSFLLGADLSNQKQPHRIVEICLDSLEILPGNPYFHSFLGNAYAAMGERELALSSWEKSITRRRSWARPRIRRAQTFLQMGRVEDALRESQQAVLVAPNRIEAAVIWALSRSANLSKSQDDSAENVLKLVNAVQRAVPGELRTLALQLALLTETNRKDEAVKVLKSVLEREEPLSEAALVRLAKTSRLAGLGLEQACYDRIEQHYGRTPKLAYAQAVRLAEEGKPDDGLELLNSERPSSAGSDLDWQLVRASYLDTIRDPDAGALWKSIADAHPDNTNVQRLALKARSVQSDRDFRDRTIDRVRNMAGEQSVNWRLERARWLIQSDDEDDIGQATAMLEQLVDDSPSLLEARLLLADGFQRQEHVGRAIEQLDAVNQLRHSSLVTLNLAKMHQSQRDFERAHEELEELIQSDSTSPKHLVDAANLLAQQGEEEKAVEILEKLHAENALEAPADYFLLARLYRRRGQIAQVQQICQQLLKAPTPTTIQFIANFYASLGRMEQANRVLGKLDELDLAPGKRESILARHLVDYASPEEALAQCRAAVDAAPQNAASWYRLISLQLKMNKPPAAIAAAQEALEHLPDDEGLKLLLQKDDLVKKLASTNLRPLVLAILTEPEYRVAAAQALELIVNSEAGKKSVAQVISTLRQFADQYPYFLTLQNELAQVYMKNQRPDDAASVATGAMTAFPRAVEPARLAAKALAMANRWHEVLVVAQEWRVRAASIPIGADMMIAEAKIRLGESHGAALQLKPYMKAAFKYPDRFQQIILAYARTLIVDGRADEAAELLTPLLTHSSHWRRAWIRLAVRTVNNEIVATDWLRRISPHLLDHTAEGLAHAQGWMMLSKRFHNDQYNKTAREILDSLVTRPDVPSTVWFAHGVAADRDGDLSTAHNSYAAALKLDPEYQVAKNNLAMILAKQASSLPDALQLAYEAVKAKPKRAAFRDTLAFVQAAMKDYDAAIATMESAIQIQPKNTVWQMNLAKILKAAGREEETDEILDKLNRGATG